MATISNTPRPGYVWDSSDNVWYPIGTGPHTHADYITSGSAINPNIVDAKGDIIAATAADTVARLAVGANDTVLTADSSTATGLKWGTVSAGSNWSLLNTGGTALTGAATITVSGISGKDKIMVLISNASTVNASQLIYIRFNTDTGSNYGFYGGELQMITNYGSGIMRSYADAVGTYIPLGQQGNDATSTVAGYVLMSGANAAGVKTYNSAAFGNPNNSCELQKGFVGGGFYNSASTISSVSIISSSGNFDAGTIFVYTSA